MVAKILSSSASFNGVAYNENKMLASELLVAENFDGLLSERASKEEYKEYLMLYAKTNDRVKKPQLHATISTKGKEHSFEELTAVAQEWLKQMGYGKQPYLIYAHKDTNNNHVHIVSVRVNENGKKINDSFEKIRSNKIINEIMGINQSEKAEQAFQRAVAYNFSSVQQFKLLCEQAGWKVSEKEDGVNLIKGGKIQKVVPKEALNEIIKNNALHNDEARTKQVKALLHKYKKGLTHTQLQGLMKEKFGIHLEFHTGKGHTTPYGYTVIDNPGKRVYKGSDLMNIKEILAPPGTQNRIDACGNLAATIIKKNSNIDFEGFQSEMKKCGYEVSERGIITLSNDRSVQLSMDREVLRGLNYRSRLREANRFNAKNIREKTALARIFFVKAYEITGTGAGMDKATVGYYANMMNAYLSNDRYIPDSMAERGISFVSYGNETYLIDNKNKEIISSSELKLNFQNSSLKINDLRKIEKFDIEKSPKHAKGARLVERFDELVNLNLGGQEADVARKRKRQICL